MNPMTNLLDNKCHNSWAVVFKVFFFSKTVPTNNQNLFIRPRNHQILNAQLTMGFMH